MPLGASSTASARTRPVQTRSCRDIPCDAGSRDETHDRGDEDHAAVTCPRHDRRRLARETPARCQVRIDDDRANPLRSVRASGLRTIDPALLNRMSSASVPRVRSVRRRMPPRQRRVTSNGAMSAASPLPQLRLVAADRVRRRARSGPPSRRRRERLRDRPSEPARCAGDERDLSCEVEQLRGRRRRRKRHRLPVRRTRCGDRYRRRAHRPPC